MRKRSSKQIFAETLPEISKRKTIDKITVQQIVEESGLSLQTFYNHFRDKADLVLWIHKSKFDELLEKLGKNGYTYRDLTLENSRFYVEHKDYVECAEPYARAGQLLAGIVRKRLQSVACAHIKAA